MGKRAIIVFVVAISVVLAVPLVAGAQSAKETTRTYDFSFTLPTAGKSGCTVCHGDPNLVKSGDTTSSIYVDETTLAGSSHAKELCTACHVDFAYETPHQNANEGQQWEVVAQSACKNCHEVEFNQVNNGAHSPAAKPGQTDAELAAQRRADDNPAEVPTCGRCHGSHEIPYLAVERHKKSGDATKTAWALKGQAEIQGSGDEMCGSCHTKETGTYADYYHGAAYKRGAPDAPACWDCHGAHQMLPADDRNSPVNPDNLTETCGKCHDDVDAQYVQYAKLIHNKEEVKSGFILYEVWGTARTALEGAIQAVASWF